MIDIAYGIVIVMIVISGALLIANIVFGITIPIYAPIKRLKDWYANREFKRPW